MSSLIPVVLCGGAGSRLWPVSREVHPKPFLRLNGGSTSLLQQTLSRALRLSGVKNVLTLTQDEIYFKTREEYAGVSNDTGVEFDYVLEPCARNTAPAIAVAAMLVAAQHGPEAIMLVTPADHVIDEQDGLFAAAVA